MSRRGKFLPDEGGGKDWGKFGIVCLLCGERFYGGIDRAARECANHATVEHPGEGRQYAACASPLSYEAEKKAKFMTTSSEAIGLERILRKHGSGWYFYALHYGIAEADDHIKRVAEMGDDGIQTLRDMVRNG